MRCTKPECGPSPAFPGIQLRHILPSKFALPSPRGGVSGEYGDQRRRLPPPLQRHLQEIVTARLADEPQVVVSGARTVGTSSPYGFRLVTDTGKIPIGWRCAVHRHSLKSQGEHAPRARRDWIFTGEVA